MKVFQLLDNYWLWKPSYCLFFHQFFVVHTSLNNIRNQGLISLRQNDLLFSCYADKYDEFWDHFVLVKPRTLGAHSIIFQVPIEIPILLVSKIYLRINVQIGFYKYWAWVHFKHEPHKYVIPLDSLTLEGIP